MATTEQRQENTTAAALLEWRFEVLLEAGYLPDQARKLARAKEVDVRVAERLLERGCPRATALRILL